MKNKIAILLGTRPEAIKLIPIYLELKKSDDFTPVLISTGQHAQMLEQIFSFFEITPDIELKVMSEGQTLSLLTSILFDRLEVVFKENEFLYAIVQGDTTTAFVAAVSAFYHNVKVVHVEAGLRTYDKHSPFPEEINRQMISKIVDIHFTPTSKATKNLYKENITNRIYEVGNPVIDSLLLADEKINKDVIVYESRFKTLIDEEKKIVLVTGHRRESFGVGLEEICNALIYIAEYYDDVQIIYPVHMNPNVNKVVYEKLGNYQNIKLIDPLPYDDLIFIMTKSWLIMTDSGGIQEEAPSLNIPVIVMRDKTEREEGVENGCAVLSGTDSKVILKQFHMIYQSQDVYANMANALNPYGNGTASQQIVKYLLIHKDCI